MPCLMQLIIIINHKENHLISMQNKQQDISPEMQRQRQAIYFGLTSVFSEEEASAALKSWALYSSESGSVFSGLNAFARDVCESFGKPDRQRELVKALNRALISKEPLPKIKEPETVATPEPEAEAAEEAADPFMVTGQIILTPEFQSFQVLINKTFEQIEKNRKEAASSGRSFLREVVEGMPWSETQQQQITSLLDTGTAVQRRAYKADQLKTFYKHFRTWLADEFGGPAADELINRAIADAEDTPAGSQYAPQSFI